MNKSKLKSSPNFHMRFRPSSSSYKNYFLLLIFFFNFEFQFIFFSVILSNHTLLRHVHPFLRSLVFRLISLLPQINLLFAFVYYQNNDMEIDLISTIFSQLMVIGNFDKRRTEFFKNCTTISYQWCQILKVLNQK